LHDQVEGAMPALAQMPFRAELAHLADLRVWRLKAYQIRAGLPGIDVPVIEGEQPHGYFEAVAMQIAALEDDLASAELVQKLRRVLRPRTIDFIYVDGGVSVAFDPVQIAVSKAAACIAARRKDYARAAALARMPSHNIMIEPATHVINAFLEEGDWRGAAGIAKEHDPRKQKVIEGLEDDRAMQYVRLHVHLAIAAAVSGDDAAAMAFLDQAEEVDRTEVERDEDGVPVSPPFHSLYMLLAGAAEGLLPRKYLHLLGPELYLVG
jgi:hypothetical protein